MYALLPLFAVVWLALAALTAAAAGAQLQPDAAPQADAAPQGPAVVPDPAPVAPDSTQTPPASTPPAPVVEAPAPPPRTVQPTPVEPEPTRASAPSATVRGSASPAPAREPGGTRARSENRTSEPRRRLAPQEGSVPRRHRQAEVPRAAPDPLLQVDAILPGDQSGGDSPSARLILAAGALLALVLVSGSLVSVASRMSRGGLR